MRYSAFGIAIGRGNAWHARYIGRKVRWTWQYGKSALVRRHRSRRGYVVAQFDDRTGPGATGWHAFKATEFKKIV